MKINALGQVTIPDELRRKHQLLPETEVEFIDSGDAVLLRKAATGEGDVRRWLNTARGMTKGRMTTDQLMDLTRGEST